MISKRWFSAVVVGSVIGLNLSGCSPTASPPAPKPATTPAISAANSKTDSSNAPTATAPVEAPFQLEEGFTLLKFDDFDAFSSEDVPDAPWAELEDGTIECTGKPPGYLYSKEKYQNFTWRLEYRFPRPKNLKSDADFKGNTGFLVYITGEHKLWPLCLEVQGKYVEMGAVRPNGGAEEVKADDDEAARQKSRKPVGDWNAVDITSKDGELTVLVNGTQVSKSQPNFLSEGLIGIQAEKHSFELRRMRIRKN